MCICHLLHCYGSIIQCTNAECKKWYHKKSVNIKNESDDDSIDINILNEWICDDCKKNNH